MAKFDSKSFNGEVFAGYVDTLPHPNKNELVKSKVIRHSERIKDLLSTQTGSQFGTIPLFGRIDGDALNYDGETDITATSMDTFEQSVIAVGRAKAWVERDFSVDITAGVDFMDEVGKQVATYWDDIDTGIVMSILKGIFAMTGTKNVDFVENHTYDISAEGEGVMTASTLNTAIQKASGDKRSKFGMVFMHSVVATNLENLKLLQFLTQTDDKGIERPLPLAHWNGRLVIVDDGMPVETDDTGNLYTTYIFGEGAFDFADLGVEVPYAMSRDEAKNGGQTTLYSRKRVCYAPYGISFTKKSVATSSPTNTELENGANWALINNGKSGSELKSINHKDIAIARIISRG